MRKILIAFTAFLFITQMNGQDDGVKFRSADLGLGGFYFKKNKSEGGGLSFSAQLTAALNKNLVATSFITGTEIPAVGSSTYNFNEYKIQYGRELQINSWFKFETFAGVGYYNQKSDNAEIIEGDCVSLPLTLNTKFYFTEKFGIGLNTNYSINKINNNFSTNVILHYNF